MTTTSALAGGAREVVTTVYRITFDSIHGSKANPTEVGPNTPSSDGLSTEPEDLIPGGYGKRKLSGE